MGGRQLPFLSYPRVALNNKLWEPKRVNVNGFLYFFFFILQIPELMVIHIPQETPQSDSSLAFHFEFIAPEGPFGESQRTQTRKSITLDKWAPHLGGKDDVSHEFSLGGDPCAGPLPAEEALGVI